MIVTMNGQEEITSIFKNLANEERTVSLITVYKSIPLAFDAQCLRVENEIAFFKAHKYQMAVTVLVKRMFIQSSFFKEFVQANVSKMDPIKYTLGLNDFRLAGNSIGRRTLVRVEPDTSIPVMLQLKESTVRAELADISIGGISVYIDPFFLDNQESANKMVSSHCEVSLHLPSDNWKQIQLKCAIRNVIRDTISGRYRIGFQLYPNKESETMLSQYVTRCQASTIQEIKTLYERSLRA